MRKKTLPPGVVEVGAICNTCKIGKRLASEASFATTSTIPETSQEMFKASVKR